MGFVRTHRLSIASFSITLGGFLLILAAVLYFRHEGAWAPHTRPYQVVTAAGGVCLVLSFLAALTALIRERSKLAVLALVLSIFNFFLYAR